MEGIAGKIVLITGGSSGLGEATARYLAARGAYVAIAARRRDRSPMTAKELISVAFSWDLIGAGPFSLKH